MLQYIILLLILLLLLWHHIILLATLFANRKSYSWRWIRISHSNSRLLRPPFDPKAPQSKHRCWSTIYIIVGRRGRQHCWSLLTLSTCRGHVADMSWACRHGADGVVSKRATTTTMSATCRADMLPTYRRHVACRHFRDFLPTRHGRHILLRELEHQGLMDLTFYGYELEEGNLPSSIWLLLPHSHMMNILTEPTRTQCPGPCGKVGTRRDTVSWA